MNYKNMFCNIDGIVEIGEYIYKYNNSGRYQLDRNLYNEVFDMTSAIYQHLDYQSYNKIIEERCDYCGACIHGFDKRRINCTSEVEIDKYFTIECPPSELTDGYFETIAEASNKYQRKYWTGWFAVEADYLKIEILYQTNDQYGNTVLMVDDIRESWNRKSTSWGNVSDFCIECDKRYTFSDYIFEFSGSNEYNGSTKNYYCETNLPSYLENVNLCL